MMPLLSCLATCAQVKVATKSKEKIDLSIEKERERVERGEREKNFKKHLLIVPECLSSVDIDWVVLFVDLVLLPLTRFFCFLSLTLAKVVLISHARFLIFEFGTRTRIYTPCETFISISSNSYKNHIFH